MWIASGLRSAPYDRGVTTAADPGQVPAGARVRQRVAFVKGHGTENDFLVVFDPDDQHRLDADLVRRMCDRRAGLGADGILRIVRAGDGWFMDYRNADGSIAEMCGNGVRVVAKYLAEYGHVDQDMDLVIETRGGPKHVTSCADGEISVDMGPGTLGPIVEIQIAITAGAPRAEAAGVSSETAGLGAPSVVWRTTKARTVDMGNPHAVALLDDPTLRTADPTASEADPTVTGNHPTASEADPTVTGNHPTLGVGSPATGQDLLATFDLSGPPRYEPTDFPQGVNVELVVRNGPRHLTMRVYERGVGETRSCGTGACAVYLVALDEEGSADASGPYTIDVPGGRLTLRLDEHGHVHLKGPAVLTASGTFFD
jgi:diaminopimelate epimerase